MDRRDILKLFGVGAAVVPLIGGVPEPEAASRLIEIPTVEPIALAQAPKLNVVGEAGMLVLIRASGGYCYRLAGRAFISSLSMEDLSHRQLNYNAKALRMNGAEWTLTGKFVSEVYAQCLPNDVAGAI